MTGYVNESTSQLGEESLIIFTPSNGVQTHDIGDTGSVYLYQLNLQDNRELLR